MNKLTRVDLDHVLGGAGVSPEISAQMQSLSSSINSLNPRPAATPTLSSSNAVPQCSGGATPVMSGWFGKQGGTPGVDQFHGPHCSSSSIPTPAGR